MTPSYSANFGMLWLTRGGVFVVANIRGGGEYGPAWHQAALLQNRQKAYDDFQAVAQDLVKRGITTPRQLGIMGGSNGGLLVSANMVERPELFGAVVCQVPLIDMIRYTQIGAGASWEAEYGDPAKPADRAWILKYSPYQNVNDKTRYPPVFFVTATSDDRVTPGARAQDGGAHGGPGPRGAVLREYRRRSRRGGRPQAGRRDVGAEFRVPEAEAVPSLGVRRNERSCARPRGRLHVRCRPLPYRAVRCGRSSCATARSAGA